MIEFFIFPVPLEFRRRMSIFSIFIIKGSMESSMFRLIYRLEEIHFAINTVNEILSNPIQSSNILI